jgi:hypothetical protein
MAAGPEFAGRYLVLALGYAYSNATGFSVTIGGVTATPVVIARNGTSNFSDAILWIALVPTGTSVSVTVSASGGPGGGVDCVCALYAMKGNKSATPTATATGTNSASISETPGGVTIGVAFSAGGANTNAAWTGLTKDTDMVLNTGIVGASAASLADTGAVSLSASVNYSVVSNGCAIALATWGP